MQNSLSPKTPGETRIPKAPSSVTPINLSKLLSPDCETKLQLPMIKTTQKVSKLETTTPSPTANRTLPLISPPNVPGTKLRRSNSSAVETTKTKMNSTTNDTKLRRVKSTLIETKRPKSLILVPGTKLPKLHENSSEMKSSKTGSGKIPQLETGKTTKETKTSKTAESKLPRIHPTSLPLKEINAEIEPIDVCQESLESSENLEDINQCGSGEEMAIREEPVKTHVTSLPPKVSKTIGIGSSKKVQGTEFKVAHSKAPTPAVSTKLPNAFSGNNTLPRSRKNVSSTNTSPIKKNPATTATEKKLPKAKLTLTGLKSPTKPPESKLPKTPTTPDETKQKALGTNNDRRRDSNATKANQPLQKNDS